MNTEYCLFTLLNVYFALDGQRAKKNNFYFIIYTSIKKVSKKKLDELMMNEKAIKICMKMVKMEIR